MEQISKKTVFSRITKRRELPVIIATLALCVIFRASSENFFSAYNMYNLLRTACIYSIIALSQACVQIVGGTSLCVGYIGAMGAVVAGVCMQELGLSGAVATLAAVAACCICGAINGLIITKLRLSAFVTTLATQFIFKGLVTGISKGFPYTGLTPDYSNFGRGDFLGIPLITLATVAILVMIWYFFRYTTTGRKVLATGGNQRAAAMAAVDVDRMIFIANVLSGLFAGIAAVWSVSLNGIAQPTTGADWMLYSFAVSVIGGTGLTGGVICPLGLAIAGFMIVIIKNGLVLMRANTYFEQTYLGLILLAACSVGAISNMVNVARRRRKFRAEQAAKIESRDL
ncbi:MAG: ABC transporter permease [Cloacibacillus sp.]